MYFLLGCKFPLNFKYLGQRAQWCISPLPPHNNMLHHLTRSSGWWWGSACCQHSQRCTLTNTMKIFTHCKSLFLGIYILIQYLWQNVFFNCSYLLASDVMNKQCGGSSINWWNQNQKRDREKWKKFTNMVKDCYRICWMLHDVQVFHVLYNLPVGWISCPFFSHFTSVSALATSIASFILCPFFTW